MAKGLLYKVKNFSFTFYSVFIHLFLTLEHIPTARKNFDLNKRLNNPQANQNSRLQSKLFLCKNFSFLRVD